MTPVPLIVHTARIGSVHGDEVLDVTAKSAGPAGRPFSPSWALLRPFLDERRHAHGTLPPSRWAEYVEGYTAEMRASWGFYRADWEALLARPRVILVCYCADPDHCHRRVLAQLLARLGAVDAGEVTP